MAILQILYAAVLLGLALEGLKNSPMSRQDNIKTLIGLFFFLAFMLGGLIPFVMSIEEGVQKTESEAFFAALLALSYLALGVQFLIAYVPKGPGAFIQSNVVYKPLVALNVLILLVFAFLVYA